MKELARSEWLHSAFRCETMPALWLLPRGLLSKITRKVAARRRARSEEGGSRLALRSLLLILPLVLTLVLLHHLHLNTRSTPQTSDLIVFEISQQSRHPPRPFASLLWGPTISAADLRLNYQFQQSPSTVAHSLDTIRTLYCKSFWSS